MESNKHSCKFYKHGCLHDNRQKICDTKRCVVFNKGNY
jgi:hypothetical protein